MASGWLEILPVKRDSRSAQTASGNENESEGTGRAFCLQVEVIVTLE